MPEGAAKLAIGHGLEPDVLLLLNDAADLLILDGVKLLRGDLARFMFGARVFQRLGPQKTADHVGAERRCGSHHGVHSVDLFQCSSRLAGRTSRMVFY